MKKGSAEHIQDGNFVFLSTLCSVTLVLNTLTDGACFQDYLIVANKIESVRRPLESNGYSEVFPS